MLPPCTPTSSGRPPSTATAKPPSPPTFRPAPTTSSPPPTAPAARLSGTCPSPSNPATTPSPSPPRTQNSSTNSRVSSPHTICALSETLASSAFVLHNRFTRQYLIPKRLILSLSLSCCHPRRGSAFVCCPCIYFLRFP